MKRTILLALLLACGTATASEWVSVGTSADGKTEFFVDATSIRIAGGIRRAWIKFVFPTHTKRAFGDDANKWESYRLVRVAFNCEQEASRVEAGTSYNTDGTSYTPDLVSSQLSWSPVTPDSAENAEMTFICAWKPK